MTSSRAFLVAALAFGLVAGTTSTIAQSRPPARPVTQAPPRHTPNLVVLIVVDQFRADYVQRYGSMWTKGLRRLVDTGAYFQLAAYPYSATLTCVGHHTIGTGAFPRTHGMIANAWFDRDARKSMPCTDDPTATSVPYGGRPGKEHHSEKWNMTTSFADELRAQSAIAPHVMSFSLKPRAAIGMIGHAGDLVMWEEDAGTWASSTAFVKQSSPVVDQWAAAHAIEKQYGRVWNRLLPASSYFFDDAGLAEPKNLDGSNTFPYAQTRPSGQVDQTFYDNWVRTPFVDEELTDMGITFSESLGKGAGTDMLAISYSALDEVGHRYGPMSHEVQDVLVRLDAQLGKLFDTLDRRVGTGKYVVALSADHGVAPIPEQMSAKGLDTGRYTARSINDRIVDAWKNFSADATSPIASGNGTDIYFTPAALATLRETPALRRAVTDAVLSAPGIQRAFWADDLVNAQSGEDTLKRAVILSFVPSRSADLILVPKQYWMTASTGTTHGTPTAYDQRVPVVLMGFGIRPGRYLSSATPADIAPTFAALAGITLPRADGRALVEAIDTTAIGGPRIR